MKISVEEKERRKEKAEEEKKKREQEARKEPKIPTIIEQDEGELRKEFQEAVISGMPGNDDDTGGGSGGGSGGGAGPNPRVEKGK